MTVSASARWPRTWPLSSHVSPRRTARLAAKAAENVGKHRVPTLRNVDKRPYASFVKAFGHNGAFKSLKQIVHYYNTRDVLPRCETAPNLKVGQTCWPAPEVAANLNTEELGTSASPSTTRTPSSRS